LGFKWITKIILKKLFKQNLFGKNKHQINSAVFKNFLNEYPEIEKYLNKILENEPNWIMK
jgi:hypothetical protein